jgi:iron complex outermembrane recepter protein
LKYLMTFTLACGAACGAHAQTAPLPPAVLPDVVVSATRSERESADVPVAIDTVRERVIREDQPQVNLSETLNRVPGISVLNRQNYAQDVQISLRGFGARSTFGVRGIRLIADGIPATSPDGQAQASSFALSSVERIEVMRGPFSSLYGNAAGGVIQLFTADGPREPTLSGSVVAGSYGTYKLDSQFGGQYRDLNYRLDVSRFHTGGFREHSAATRDITNGKFKLPVASGLLTLVVNTLDQPEAQDPLGLTRAQVAQNPRQVDTAAITFNTRKSVRQNQAGLVYEFETDARNQFQARVYSGDRQVTQYLAIPLSVNGRLVQLAETHSGGVVDLDRGYGGAGLRWTHAVIEGDRPLTLTGGLDYDRQAENRKGFINNNGIVGALKRDERDVVSSTDAYAQLEWRMSERWSSAAGLRHSRVRFDSQDYFTANGDDSGAVSFVKTNPVAGVVYRLSSAWNVYANIGRGFETPTFAELAYRPNNQLGLNFALQPSTSLHKEIGLKGRLTSATRLNLALFHINTTNEIVVNSATGGRTDYKNAPGTRRDGIEFSVDTRLPAGFEAYAGYTRLNAEFTQPFTSSGAVVPAGSKLAGVPQNSLFGELVWRHAASGFHAGAEVRAAGRVFVDDLNSESASPYTVANLRAGFEQRSKKWRVTEFVRVDNVTDRQYVGSVIVADTNRRFYEPSPGRNYLVGVSGSFRF